MICKTDASDEKRKKETTQMEDQTARPDGIIDGGWLPG